MLARISGCLARFGFLRVLALTFLWSEWPSQTPSGHYTCSTKLTVSSNLNNEGIFLCHTPQSSVPQILKRFTPLDIAHGAADKEAAIMSSLSHPNITKIYSWYITPDRKEGGIYMEYCDQGNLEDWLNVAKQTYEQDGTQIDAEFVLHVMEGLTSAVAYLHSGLDGGKCVIHRDIKPANIFLSSYDQDGTKVSGTFPRVVLGDFGISEMCLEGLGRQTAGGLDILDMGRKADMRAIREVLQDFLIFGEVSKELTDLLRLRWGEYQYLHSQGTGAEALKAGELLAKIREVRGAKGVGHPSC